MQAKSLIRNLIAALSIVLVATALIGATWYSAKVLPTAMPMVGVPTGEFQNGAAVHRLPSITVTASRSEELAKMARE